MLDIDSHGGQIHHRPSFICVRPERTGTSWLYATLQPHPDIFLTPVKEIRYFYETLEYPGEGWRARLSKAGDWHARDYRAYLKERIVHYRQNPRDLFLNWRRVLWDYRYIFGKRGNNWYFSLFAGAGNRKSGDISPQYFSIPGQQKENLRKLLPNVKIIIFLRDPIDWCWSFARMTLIGNQPVENIPDEMFFDFFQRYRNYYPTVAAIDRWYRCFSREQIHIGFHDLLSDAPLSFYQKICSFIGIDEEQAPPNVLDTMSRRLNKGRDVAMPHRFAVYLAESWRKEIQQLCDVFSPYPQRWLQRSIAILDSKAKIRPSDSQSFEEHSDRKK